MDLGPRATDGLESADVNSIQSTQPFAGSQTTSAAHLTSDPPILLLSSMFLWEIRPEEGIGTAVIPT
jgi:hypothetical protein